jgi:hypothetical protein
MFRFFQLSKTAAILALALVLLLPPKTALLEVLIPDGAGNLHVIHQYWSPSGTNVSRETFVHGRGSFMGLIRSVVALPCIKPMPGPFSLFF